LLPEDAARLNCKIYLLSINNHLSLQQISFLVVMDIKEDHRCVSYFFPPTTTLPRFLKIDSSFTVSFQHFKNLATSCKYFSEVKIVAEKLDSVFSYSVYTSARYSMVKRSPSCGVAGVVLNKQKIVVFFQLFNE
jgi:hypothetical protein